MDDVKHALITAAFLFGAVFSCTSHAQTAVELWQTAPVLSSPESVVYDPKRDVLYVSNMRNSDHSKTKVHGEFISKVSLTGEVLNLHWVKDLATPTGIALFSDTLYIVERTGIAIINRYFYSVRKP